MHSFRISKQIQLPTSTIPSGAACVKRHLRIGPQYCALPAGHAEAIGDRFGKVSASSPNISVWPNSEVGDRPVLKARLAQRTEFLAAVTLFRTEYWLLRSESSCVALDRASFSEPAYTVTCSGRRCSQTGTLRGSCEKAKPII